MSLNAERGATITYTRAEIFYSLIKKVISINETYKKAQISQAVADYYEQHIDEVQQQEGGWLAGKSDNFLRNKTWLNRHTNDIQIVAAADGYSFMRSYKPLCCGFQLTRKVKEIKADMEKRQKDIETRMEHHNDLVEKLSGNPKYKKLQMPLFNETLLPAPS